MTMSACIIRIAGMPYRKYQCLVLWWKKCIPMMLPILLPIKASTNKVDSGIRQERFLALCLSTPITVKLIKLITVKYIIINVIAFIRLTMSFSEYGIIIA